VAKYEKWLGAGIGWMVTGGPIGSLLGFVAGSALESGEKKYKKTAHTSEFETSLLVLAAAVVKADGKISLSEMHFVRAFFRDNFSPEYLDEKMAIFDHCLRKGYDPRKACDEIRPTASRSTKIQIVNFLFELAIADDTLSKTESDLIFVLSGWLNINDVEFKKIKAAYLNNAGINSNYQLLGVSAYASYDEIKAAYRKLVLEYHPDRNLNLSSTEHAKLAEKFRKIQEAFEKIKLERGYDA
jgi:DnaJ like chaperone protein